LDILAPLSKIFESPDLKNSSDHPRIAIAWTAALTQFPIDRVEQLMAAVPGVQWVSVERNLPPDHLLKNFSAERFIHVGDQTSADMAALASVLSACDAAVLVDGTAAHVAGALGVPTWVLIGERAPAAAWRWCHHWYPSARPMRARRGKNWADVTARVVAELGKEIKTA